MSEALIVRRTIRAPIERVFAAWTEPEHVRAWWGPEGVDCSACEIDLRVGGRYRIDNTLPDGRVVRIAGEFVRIAPPRELVYTWTVDGGAAEQVTVRFAPRDGGTEVVVVHEHIAAPAVRDGHEAGWVGCLDGLEAFLA